MHRKGEIDNSVLSATRAFKIFNNINDRLGVAEVYKLMGMNYRSYGNYDLAEVYLGNSLRINERHDDALLHLRQGSVPAAGRFHLSAVRTR